ncbi:MAG TPA: hypothetical protein ENK43_16565 [Planctomycetes bacterium]|nr:hypothetical protein [Planctomycetota bacterium]
MRTTTIAGVLVLASLFGGRLPAQDILAHPDIPLLNAQGESVLTRNAPLSLKESCNGCHDTAYIASHSYHVSLGTPEERAARFDPLTLDTFRPGRGTAAELATWLRTRGARHVGGGFAASPPKDGTFDFAAAGATEMNCLLCHLPRPDDEARRRELAAGRFAWVSTATLGKTPVVTRKGEDWSWNREVFDEKGQVKGELLGLRTPRASNCAICHGFVPPKRNEPFFLRPGASHPETETTGSIFAADRIRESGMNVAGKDDLRRPWDVHAERLLECSDCHGSLNDPAYDAELPPTEPKHLAVEPRRLDLREFLRTPSHDFAKGHVSQSQVARRLDGSMRRCEDCHAAEKTHAFLPYRDRHFTSMQCEACHIPKEYAPTRQQTDWTLLGPDGDALVVYRGVSGDPSDPRTLVRGYTPTLLPRKELDGTRRLTPQNLMSTFFWVDGAHGEKVSRDVLARAIFGGTEGTYRPALVEALDTNGDGRLEGRELRLDTAKKTAVMAGLLENEGVKNPMIRGEILPYGVHHGVAPARFATKDCNGCHGVESRVGREFQIAAYLPGGVTPHLPEDALVTLPGRLAPTSDGALVFQPDPTAAGLRVLGFGTDRLVDRIGQWAVILVLVGVFFHGGIRIFLHFYSRNAPPKEDAS